MARNSMARLAQGGPTLALALALAGCPAGAGLKPPTGAPTPPGAKPGASLIGNGGNTLIGMDGGSLIGLDGGSLIGMDGGSLIGQDGGSIKGSVKAPAGLIGMDGGSLVGMDGGSLVAAGAGNAVSDLGAAYRVQAVAEKPLAGVHVYLRDAQGRFLLGKDKKLVVAKTDAQGRFDFKGYKAARGLVAFVPSAKVGAEVRGLAGLHPKDLAGDLAIDLASSLAASWVERKVLATQADKAASLDRLPAALEAELRAATLAAVGEEAPSGLGTLAPAAFAAKLDELRAKAPALAAVQDRVFRVMDLAGADNTLVSGRGAREVTLQQPMAVAEGPDGSLYVAEAVGGIVRRIQPDGTLTIVAGPGSPSEREIGALKPRGLAVGPKGEVYVGSEIGRAIFRFSPDGSQYGRVAGRGGILPGRIATGDKATEAPIGTPDGMAIDADGSLVFGEDGEREEVDRLLRLRADGTLEVLPAPWAGLPPHPTGRHVQALAIGADGTWWCLDGEHRQVWRRPAGGAWQGFAQQVPVAAWAALLAEPDGTALLSIGGILGAGADRMMDHRIVRMAADGALTPFAGNQAGGLADGPAGATAFFEPGGMARRKDGTLLVADAGNGLVRAIAADGTATDVAGLRSPASIAMAAPLNVPGGLAVDGAGRVVVSEVAGQAIRRLEGDRLVRIAGGTPGMVGLDGAVVPADRLYGPTGLAYRGDDLFFTEGGNRLIRKLRPDGMMELVAGGGKDAIRQAPTGPIDARAHFLGELSSIAVGPDGLVYFIERDNGGRQQSHVWRITAAGRLELVAGAFDREIDAEGRDGKPAKDVAIGRVVGLAFAPSGKLYLAEMSGCEVLEVDQAGVLRRFAGVGVGATALKVLAGEAEKEGDLPAREVTLLVPVGLAVDAAGAVYVTELGTGVGQAFTAQLGEGLDLPSASVLPGRIRRIGTDGIARTIAGLGAPAGTGQVRYPVAIAVTPDGKIYFVDNATNQVKELK